MFDPLANFKLNKIKKGVDSVKAAVDALPTSLSSSFTDVKNAISGVSTKVDGVGVSLEESFTLQGFNLPSTGTTFSRGDNTGIPAQTIDIVDVSGSGRLEFILVKWLNKSNKVTLTIDDTTFTILCSSAGAGDTSGPSNKGLFILGNDSSPLFFISNISGNRQELYVNTLCDALSEGIIGIEDDDIYLFTKNGLVSRSNVSRTIDYYWYKKIAVAKDIVFNNNLKITLTLSNSERGNNTYYIAGAYTLF